MKFQLVFVAVLVLAICASGNAQATQPGVGSIGPVGPPSFCQIQINILQSEANKINTPELPEDLRLRLAAVIENAAQGCSDCDNLVAWLNKVCIVVNLRAGLNQLSQIKAEADARATTVVAPVGSTQ